jgi:hypothetical protein
MSLHRALPGIAALICTYFILGVVTLGPIQKAWRTGCHPIASEDITIVLLWPVLYIDSQTRPSGC